MCVCVCVCVCVRVWIIKIHVSRAHEVTNQRVIAKDFPNYEI